MSILNWHGKPLTPARIIQAVQVRIRDRLQPTNDVRGVYASFAEAVAAAPRTKPTGYDSAGAGNWYQDKLTGVQLEDYPVLFWLERAFADSRTVFEIGGHVGVAYYGFSKLVRYPDGHQWTILDVPSVADAGRKLAASRGVTNLHFASDASGGDGAEIVLAAGALQYLERGLADILSGWKQKPKHILINVTPVYDGPAFVTVQNVSSAYCAYRIFNRQELIDGLDAIGYSLVDSWSKPRPLRVPGRPDRSFDRYSGFYFRRR